MNHCRLLLRRGLADLALEIEETRLDALLKFIALIAKWNKAYNLTAVRDPEDMVALHLLDSLAIMPYIKPPLVADIGTGAGLPGIPLAICMPDCRFVLIDANAKKTRFVQQAILELQLKNVQVLHSRVESYEPEQLFSAVIARAFTDMGGILKLTGHLLADDGLLLAMKGRRPDLELAELHSDFTVIPINVPGVDAERCLIRLEKRFHG